MSVSELGRYPIVQEMIQVFREAPLTTISLSKPRSSLLLTVSAERAKSTIFPRTQAGTIIAHSFSVRHIPRLCVDRL